MVHYHDGILLRRMHPHQTTWANHCLSLVESPAGYEASIIRLQSGDEAKWLETLPYSAGTSWIYSSRNPSQHGAHYAKRYFQCWWRVGWLQDDTLSKKTGLRRKENELNQGVCLKGNASHKAQIEQTSRSCRAHFSLLAAIQFLSSGSSSWSWSNNLLPMQKWSLLWTTTSCARSRWIMKNSSSTRSCSLNWTWFSCRTFTIINVKSVSLYVSWSHIRYFPSI